jgi:hypothetical protein
MSVQLQQYVAELAANNPGVDVYNLAQPGTTATVRDNLNIMAFELDEALETNSNNFGGGRISLNAVVGYDFQRFLKGWSVSANANYKGAPYTGAYEIREGGTASGELIDTVPVYGASTTDLGGMVRYVRRIKKTKVTFQLDVSNLANDTEPLVRRVQTRVIAPGDAAPSEFTPTSYFIRYPRTWRFTTQFDF